MLCKNLEGFVSLPKYEQDRSPKNAINTRPIYILRKKSMLFLKLIIISAKKSSAHKYIHFCSSLETQHVDRTLRSAQLNYRENVYQWPDARVHLSSPESKWYLVENHLWAHFLASQFHKIIVIRAVNYPEISYIHFRLQSITK